VSGRWAQGVGAARRARGCTTAQRWRRGCAGRCDSRAGRVCVHAGGFQAQKQRRAQSVRATQKCASVCVWDEDCSGSGLAQLRSSLGVDVGGRGSSCAQQGCTRATGQGPGVVFPKDTPSTPSPMAGSRRAQRGAGGVTAPARRVRRAQTTWTHKAWAAGPLRLWWSARHRRPTRSSVSWDHGAPPPVAARLL
jgi:hypothetical protein